MPLFAIIAFDAPGSGVKRIDYAKTHIEVLADLQNVGRLFAAGPLCESLDENAANVGSILIIDFASQAEAEEWFNEEPYFKAGVYKTVTIRPYLDALNFIPSFIKQQKQEQL